MPKVTLAAPRRHTSPVGCMLFNTLPEAAPVCYVYNLAGCSGTVVLSHTRSIAFDRLLSAGRQSLQCMFQALVVMC